MQVHAAAASMLHRGRARGAPASSAARATIAATTPRAAMRAPSRRAAVQPVAALPSGQDGDVFTELKEFGRRAAAAASGVVCAASLLLSSSGPAAAALSVDDVAAALAQQQQQQEQPATTVLRLPASEDPAILTAQQTMVQAWSIVGESFFDADFGGADWTDELRRHMLAAYASGSATAAYGEIAAMLKDLKDPYTRLLPPDEYADFMVASNGEMQGVGMLIANEPVDGHLLVLAPIKGSPADRAGVRPGDILTAINGEDTAGWTGEQAAHHLRGKGGTQVRVRLVRRTDAIPGVPGRPPPPRDALLRTAGGGGGATASGSGGAEVVVEVSLTRETVSLSPLMYGELPGPRGARLGYLKLASFSQNAGVAVRDAIRELQGRGVGGFVLDLRSNPGGLVQSAADVARVFLGGHPTLFSVSGRSGEQLQEIALEDGRPETTAPLAVLVDRGSASASEILSGALHDNRRAVVVGDESTYGKGRIQSVFELDDGSALFVTVARYRTPAGAEIDLKGIAPDVGCAAPALAGYPAHPASSSSSSSNVGSLAAGSASSALAAAAAAAFDTDEPDRCLLTAVNLLADQTPRMEATAAAVAAGAAMARP